MEAQIRAEAVLAEFKTWVSGPRKEHLTIPRIRKLGINARDIINMLVYPAAGDSGLDYWEFTEYSGAGAEMGDAFAVALATWMNEHSKIRIALVNFSGNLLSDEGAVAVSGKLIPIYVSHLNLSNNNITANGIKGIMENFVLDDHLVLHFNVSRNHIGDAGVKAMALRLPGSPLKFLNISHADVGVEGARVLAELLKRHDCNLTSLYVHENHAIGDAGFSLLADAVPRSKLTSLDVRGCNISDGAIERFVPLIETTRLENFYTDADDSLMSIMYACNRNADNARVLAMAIERSKPRVRPRPDAPLIGKLAQSFRLFGNEPVVNRVMDFLLETPRQRGVPPPPATVADDEEYVYSDGE